jgi:hypothetical protein
MTGNTDSIYAALNVDLAKLEAVYGQAHAAFPVTTVLYDIALPVWKLFRDKSGSEVATEQWALFVKCWRLSWRLREYMFWVSMGTAW